MNYKDCAFLFKALGDETRLQIVDILKNGPKCACELLKEFDITQPTFSYHMKILVNSEIVESNKNGIWQNYNLNFEKLENLSKCTLKNERCYNKKD